MAENEKLYCNGIVPRGIALPLDNRNTIYSTAGARGVDGCGGVFCGAKAESKRGGCEMDGVERGGEAARLGLLRRERWMNGGSERGANIEPSGDHSSAPHLSAR